MKVGGVERSLVTLLRTMNHDEYDVTLLLLEDLGDYVTQIPPQVKVIYYDTKEWFGPFKELLRTAFETKKFTALKFRIIYKLGRIFTKHLYAILPRLMKIQRDYDIVIAYRPGFCADFGAYAFRGDKKVVWWHHGEINVPVEKLAEYEHDWHHFNQVIAPTEGVKDLLMVAIPLYEDQITVIPNRVDVDDIRRQAEEDVPTFTTDDDTIRVVTVSRLSSEKELTGVVVVAKDLTFNGMKLEWLVVGDGPERERLQTWIDFLGLKDVVKLVGAQANPYPFIRKADILFHPSPVESQGLVIHEALALNKMVIAAASIGSRSIQHKDLRIYKNAAINSAFIFEGLNLQDLRKRRDREYEDYVMEDHLVEYIY